MEAKAIIQSWFPSAGAVAGGKDVPKQLQEAIRRSLPEMWLARVASFIPVAISAEPPATLQLQLVPAIDADLPGYATKRATHILRIDHLATIETLDLILFLMLNLVDNVLLFSLLAFLPSLV